MTKNIRARGIRILKTCTLGRPGYVINGHQVTGITENYVRRYIAQGVLEYVEDPEPEPEPEAEPEATPQVRRKKRQPTIDVEIREERPEVEGQP